MHKVLSFQHIRKHCLMLFKMLWHNPKHINTHLHPSLVWRGWTFVSHHKRALHLNLQSSKQLLLFIRYTVIATRARSGCVLLQMLWRNLLLTCWLQQLWEHCTREPLWSSLNGEAAGVCSISDGADSMADWPTKQSGGAGSDLHTAALICSLVSGITQV